MKKTQGLGLEWAYGGPQNRNEQALFVFDVLSLPSSRYATTNTSTWTTGQDIGRSINIIFVSTRNFILPLHYLGKYLDYAVSCMVLFLLFQHYSKLTDGSGVVITCGMGWWKKAIQVVASELHENLLSCRRLSAFVSIKPNLLCPFMDSCSSSLGTILHATLCRKQRRQKERTKKRKTATHSHKTDFLRLCKSGRSLSGWLRAVHS